MFTTKIILIASAISIAAVGGWGGWQYIQRNSAEKDKVQAVAARDQALQNLAVAIDANKSNQATIDQLQIEKISIEQALANLEANRKRDAKIIGSLSAAIKDQSKDPANQVTLSPVLKAVIAQIQAERDKRQGVKK